MPEDPILTSVDQPSTGFLKFRLLHLLVLIAVVAVLLAVNDLHSAPSQGTREQELFRVLFLGSRILFLLLSAIAITVAGFALYRRQLGSPFLTQPGHWLLLGNAILSLVGCVSSLAMRLARANLEDPRVLFSLVPLSTTLV